MQNIKTMFSMQSRKATVAALMAALAAATLAATDGINLVEWLTIAGAAVAAWQATYWTSNIKPSTTG